MCTQLPMYADAESKSEELAVVHLKKTTLVEMLCIIKILKICPNLSAKVQTTTPYYAVLDKVVRICQNVPTLLTLCFRRVFAYKLKK